MKSKGVVIFRIRLHGLDVSSGLQNCSVDFFFAIHET